MQFQIVAWNLEELNICSYQNKNLHKQIKLNQRIQNNVIYRVQKMIQQNKGEKAYKIWN